MRNIRSVLLLVLVLASTLTYMFTQPPPVSPIEALEDDDLVSRLNACPRSVHRTDRESKNNQFDFTRFRSFIIDNLWSERGGFAISKGGEEYINATYYGVLMMYVLGLLSKNRSDALKKWLEYAYDEDCSGFREWLGGNATLKGTLWGLLIINFTSIAPDDFGLNTTLQFINDTIRNVSVDSMDLLTCSLMLMVFSKYRHRIAGTYLDRVIQNVSRRLFSFYNTTSGLFYDKNLRMSQIYQTHTALLALSEYDKDLINMSMASSLANSLLGMMHKAANESDKMVGGFGANPNRPTVLETGLAVDLLVFLNLSGMLDENTSRILQNESFWRNVTLFVNRSQAENGGVRENPKSRTMDIFQSFGAILVFLDLGRLESFIDVSETIRPGEQIAIDSDQIIDIRLSVRIFGEIVPCLRTSYLLERWSSPIESGKLKFSNDKYELSLGKPNELGFGNYRLTVLLWKNISFHGLFLRRILWFRIGYDISLRSKSIVRPGENVTFEVVVEYSNGTKVGSGILHYWLVGPKENLLCEGDITLGQTPLNICYVLPKNASLGEYRLYTYLSDAHGVNHTYAWMTFYVDDNILFELSENISELYVGESISVLIRNLTYNSTRRPISTTANISVEIRYPSGAVLSKQNACYILRPKRIDVQCVMDVPPILPSSRNVTVWLVLVWDNTTYGTKILHLFNASLRIGKIFVSNVSITQNNQTDCLPTLYIGQRYNISFSLIHVANVTRDGSLNVESCILENATVNVTIGTNNKSWVTESYNFSAENKGYSGELYLNPNLPFGENNMTFWVFLELNNSWLNVTSLPIIILGTPVVTSMHFPRTAVVGEFYIANFSIICNETNALLANMSLYANVTFVRRGGKENITAMIPISVRNTSYSLAFEVNESEIMRIDIFRMSDDLRLLSVLLPVMQRRGKIFEMDPWLIPLPMIVVAYTVYFIIRWRLSRRVSKRFLIERARGR